MSRNQQKDKQKFLEKLAKTPIVEVACKQTGLPRTTYYRWLKQDKAFAEACDEAAQRSSDLINDMAEAQLITAIKEGNLTAVMYWLNHRHRAYATKVEIGGKLALENYQLTPEQQELVQRALLQSNLLTSNKEDQQNGQSTTKH